MMEFCRAALLGFFFLFSFAAQAETWRYADERGAMHFVQSRDEIPAQYQNSAELVSGGVNVEKAQVQQPQNNAPQAPVAGAPQEAAAPQENSSVDADLAELERQRNAAAAKANSLNQINPLAETKMGEAGGAEMLPPQLQWIGKAISDPRIQKLGVHLRSPQVMESIDAIAKNENWSYALGGQGLLLLFLAYVQYRVQQRKPGFIAGLAVKAFTFVALLVGAAAISYAVYGEPLRIIAMAFWKAFS